MPARTIVCSECSETVPSGRLTCPACGAMLASIAGGSIRPSVKGKDAVADHVPSDDPSAMAPARIQTTALPEASPDDAPAQTHRAIGGPAIPLAPSSIRQTQVEMSGPMAMAPVAAASAADGGYLPPGTPMSPATPPGPALSAAAAPDLPRRLPARRTQPRTIRRRSRSRSISRGWTRRSAMPRRPGPA